MRLLSVIISTAATGYLAYVTADELRHPSSTPAAAPIVASNASSAAESTPSEPEAPAPDAPEDPATPAPVAVAPTPAPESPKIRTAPPDSFYLTQRVSIENSAGIIAILPGEVVRLIYRNKDGTARVKWGAESLTVPEAQLTREFDLTTNRPIPTQRAIAGTKLLGQRANPQSGSRRE